MEEKDTKQPGGVSSKETTPNVEAPNGTDQSHPDVGEVVKVADSGKQGSQTVDLEDEDTANEAELSPPPDSSSVSSVNPDMLGDEIVVGTHANNGQKNAFGSVRSDHGDEDMADLDGDDLVSPYPKRKRSAIYNDLAEDTMEVGSTKDGDDARSTPHLQKRHGSAQARGITLGYWRDSPVPDEEGKHGVIGFMDVRDRLRTRIQTTTRNGDSINARLYPIPPGPGGSWVTFERVVFEDHLVGLDHHEVKEYVKIREAQKEKDTPEEQKKQEIAAAEEAKRRLILNPATEANQQPSIAFGKDLPANVQSGRPEKRRRLNGAFGAGGSMGGQQALTSLHSQQQQRGLSPLHGTRPTRILVGCWLKSQSTDDSERHAVFGILGANDMFRVKLMKETMDGRYLEGNFPTGAGALWINYEEVKFLPHLQNLTRPEMKEYIRVRQSQIDHGETEETRVSNETKAVYEAQRRTALLTKHNPTGNSAPRYSVGPVDRDDGPGISKSEARGLELPSHEMLQDRRDVMPRPDGRPSRHSLPEPGLRLGSRHNSLDVERQKGLVSRAIDRMELAQSRDEQNATQRAAALSTTPVTATHDARREFQDNIQRMDKIWQAQELNRRGPGNDNIKVHAGVKYERKRGGPFEGKLVSQGTIISIDGEDYVEYRVLTKPTFF